MDIVPPPLKTTVTRTMTNTVVSIICLATEDVLRMARAKATAPRSPQKNNNPDIKKMAAVASQISNEG